MELETKIFIGVGCWVMGAIFLFTGFFELMYLFGGLLLLFLILMGVNSLVKSEMALKWKTAIVGSVVLWIIGFFINIIHHRITLWNRYFASKHWCKKRMGRSFRPFPGISG